MGQDILKYCKNIKKIINNFSIKCKLGSINIYDEGNWYLAIQIPLLLKFPMDKQQQYIGNSNEKWYS